MNTRKATGGEVVTEPSREAGRGGAKMTSTKLVNVSSHVNLLCLAGIHVDKDEEHWNRYSYQNWLDQSRGTSTPWPWWGEDNFDEVSESNIDRASFPLIFRTSRGHGAVMGHLDHEIFENSHPLSIKISPCLRNSSANVVFLID